MKRLPLIFLLFWLFCSIAVAQNNVGINDDNSVPKASAMLDVYSASKGLLIPRMALTSTTTAAPVTSPVESLLIYNTATTGDVTPGYYYWDGSTQWVRLVAAADPLRRLATVSKTTNAALQKSDNMVFASGDITLTLPVVTSADNGLEISVKNSGTYMDVVTITGATGAEFIDGSLSSIHYKNWGRTYIAKDGNWVRKENVGLPDNVFDVSAKSSWTTIAQIVEFLGAHMTGPSLVAIGGGTYSVASTQTINLPYPVTFKGVSYGETTIAGIAGVSGTPLFICQTECHFKMLYLTAFANAAGNDAIRLSGSGRYHEIKDCKFSGFNKGVVSTTNNNLWLFDVDFNTCTAAGVEIAAGAASGGSLKISEADFIQCASGISLLSGLAEAISILNCTFYNTLAGTDTGVLYSPATFTSYASMFITNNSWNNQGTFFSGFDFTRADGRDANVFLINNAGSENQNPHCRITVTNYTTFTLVVTAGTYVKAGWVNTSSFTCNWAISDNRITYQPSNKSSSWAVISGNISVDKNATVTLAIVKNGITTTRYGESDLRIATTNQPFQFSTVIYVHDLAKNDYLELFATTNVNNIKVTFQDIQWYTTTQ